MEQYAAPTAAACSRQSCDDCEIHGDLICVATPLDLADFGILFVNWLIPFLAGMIAGAFWIGLAVWAGLVALFFGYVEAFVLCRHCPAYAEEGSTLRCHANWGLPKFPRFDPRPLNRIEGATFLGYGAVLFLYHIPFFVLSEQWLLLVWCTLATGLAVWVVQRTQCTRCYHLSCPGNRVPEEVRRRFFENYPEFAETWEKSGRQTGV